MTDGTFLPEAVFPHLDAVRGMAKKLYTLERLTEALPALDYKPSVILPPALTLLPRVLNAKKPKMAMAKKTALTLRLRTAQGAHCVAAALAEVKDTDPSDPWHACGRQAVTARMKDTFFADAGATYTMGRWQKYYEADVDEPYQRVTPAEAAAAMTACGMDLKLEKYMPYNVVQDETPDIPSLWINPKSNNGSPVFLKWEDPQARTMVLANTARVLVDLHNRDHDEVYKYVEDLMKEEPTFVLCTGSCKNDYYTAAKIKGLAMRFYNIIPRHIVLTVQTITQAYQDNCRHALEDPASHSFLGVTLTRGGADRLVARMDAELAKTGAAYLHCGDDSWVVLRCGDGKLIMLTLDCSSYDLTQQNHVTLEARKAIEAQLAKWSVGRAALWAKFMDARLTTISTSVVALIDNAGPSGMPLQSKVNDLLMEVMITRFLKAARMAMAMTKGYLSKTDVSTLVMSVATAMGFTARMETYAEEKGVETVHEMLVAHPFLFVGYYFWNSDGVILPFVDLARTLSQARTPRFGFCTNKELPLFEAYRLGSIAQGLGVAPPHLRAAQDAFVACALELLEQAIESVSPAQKEKHEKAGLAWLVGHNPAGPKEAKSLAGLHSALEAWESLWHPLPEGEEEEVDEAREGYAAATARKRAPVAIGWDMDTDAPLVDVLIGGPPLPKLPALRVKPAGEHRVSPSPRESTPGRPPPTAPYTHKELLAAAARIRAEREAAMGLQVPAEEAAPAKRVKARFGGKRDKRRAGVVEAVDPRTVEHYETEDREERDEEHQLDVEDLEDAVDDEFD